MRLILHLWLQKLTYLQKPYNLELQSRRMHEDGDDMENDKMRRLRLLGWSSVTQNYLCDSVTVSHPSSKVDSALVTRKPYTSELLLPRTSPRIP